MHYYIVVADTIPWMYMDMAKQAMDILETDGNTCEVVGQATSPVPPDTRYLFVGTKYEQWHVPADSIITNFDCPEIVFSILTDEVIKTCEIWDYSQKNIDLIREKFPQARCKLFHMGFTPRLDYGVCHLEPLKDIDVLLIGFRTPRRDAILNALSSQGYTVQAIYGYIDAARADYIRRSKVCISVYGHPNQGETISASRMAPILCSRGFIVTENCTDQEQNDRWKQFAVSVDYDKLVETVVYYITHVEERVQLQKDYVEKFRLTHPYVVNVS